VEEGLERSPTQQCCKSIRRETLRFLKAQSASGSVGRYYKKKLLHMLWLNFASSAPTTGVMF
jgi:hypothetical protein